MEKCVKSKETKRRVINHQLLERSVQIEIILKIESNIGEMRRNPNMTSQLIIIKFMNDQSKNGFLNLQIFFSINP